MSDLYVTFCPELENHISHTQPVISHRHRQWAKESHPVRQQASQLLCLEVNSKEKLSQSLNIILLVHLT